MNRQLIVYESLAKTCNEFDKLRVMRACVSTCLCVSVVYVATCHRRANFSFLRASVTKNVLRPYGALMFQLGAQLCWKPCHFSNFSLTKCEGKFVYFIILYKKFYILLDSIIIHIICIYIVHKNCMILHFYTSFYIKQKFVEFFFSIIFFVFAI